MFSSVQLADGLCVLIANARSLWHNDSLQSLCSARRVSTSVRYVVKSVGTALRDQLANDLQPASGYCHRQSSIAVRVSNVAHLLLTPPRSPWLLTSCGVSNAFLMNFCYEPDTGTCPACLPVACTTVAAWPRRPAFCFTTALFAAAHRAYWRPSIQWFAYLANLI